MTQAVTLPADWEERMEQMVRRLITEMVDQTLRERLPLVGTEAEARFIELLDRRFERLLTLQDKRFEAILREMDARFEAAAQERKAILDMMNKGFETAAQERQALQQRLEALMREMDARFEAAAQERRAILQRLEGLQRQMNLMLVLFGIWLSLLSLLAGWIALYR